MVGTGASSRPCWGRMRARPSLPCNTRPAAISAGGGGSGAMVESDLGWTVLCSSKGEAGGPPEFGSESHTRHRTCLEEFWLRIPHSLSGLGKVFGKTRVPDGEPRWACLVPSLSTPPVRDSADGRRERAGFPGSWNSLALSYLTPAMSTCSRTDPRGKCLLQLSKHSGGKRLQPPLFLETPVSLLGIFL